MRFLIITALILLPSVSFAEAAKSDRYTVVNVKVKEKNAIGKSQDSERTILLDQAQGKVWLFVAGKEESDLRLFPVNLDATSTTKITNKKGK